MMPSRLWVPGSIVLAVLVSEPDRTRAQDRTPVTRDEAVLSVDGVVREVFQSPRRDRVDYIVQIEVKRSELLRTPRTPARVPVPAPGDMVYAHASQTQNTALGLGGQSGPTADSTRDGASGAGRAIPGSRLSPSQGKQRLGRRGK